MTHLQHARWRARRATLAAVASLLAVAPLDGAAQESQAAGSGTAAPGAESHGSIAIRGVRATGSIRIDGVIDDAAWHEAVAVTAFTQVDPDEGKPASQRTVVRVLFGEDAVYVAAVLYDTEPVSLRLARRDASFGDSDVFAVAFDSYHDHQTAFRFALNASGVKRDEVITSTGGGGDASWDPVWDGVAAVTDSGWVAELRIPLSQLRFRSGSEQTWGLQLERRIARNQEYAVYAFTPKRQRGGPPRFAHLEGMTLRGGTHRLELLPYALVRADYRPVPRHPAVTFANPFRDRSDYGIGVGGDLKFRITSNFTLDATVNPDFGQVEADPAQINLSAFETRLSERRPFFVEGAEIFRFGSSLNFSQQMVYSRRVGRTPQGGTPSETIYADAPETATILGAAKVTGKTAGGWALGILEAVTARETVPYVDAAQQPGAAVVEPATSYFAARARRSYRSGSAAAGGILTAVHRRLDDTTLAAQLRSSAYVAGADFRAEWGNRDYSLSAEVVGSRVQGSEAAMLRTQRSSARYFQRPDAPHLAIDSAATALHGYATFVAVGKFAGDWQRNVRLFATSPGYEINDLGFQPTADRRGINSDFSYRQNTPGRVLRRWEASTGPDAVWNYAGDLVDAGIGSRVGATLLNYWSGNVSFNIQPRSMDDRLTRGGPLARTPASRSLNASVSSNPRQRVTFNMGGRYGRNEAGGFHSGIETSVTVKPASSVELRIGPELNRSRTVAQYVTAVSDATEAETFGRRYVFASIDQATLSMRMRANVAFSPALTIESYVEPFVSSGDYGALKQLRTPGTYEFDTYGVDRGTVTRGDDGTFSIDPDADGPAPGFSVRDRDYSFRSLVGSAVLRWEWNPGSTLYLVWQQNRSLNRIVTGDPAIDDRIGRFDPVGESRGLFAIPPQNVLQLKVTYWLNP